MHVQDESDVERNVTRIYQFDSLKDKLKWEESASTASFSGSASYIEQDDEEMSVEESWCFRYIDCFSTYAFRTLVDGYFLSRLVIHNFVRTQVINDSSSPPDVLQKAINWLIAISFLTFK